MRRGGARILRGGAFKPRSSPYAFQGHGLEGLKMLAQARAETGLAIVTEVMSEDDVALVAEYADILQIGSRNMENFSLLEAAARSGRPILLKRGMMATVADLLRSAQIVLDNGNPNVILCERGIRTFETALRNTFDAAAIALIKAYLASSCYCGPEPRLRSSRSGSCSGSHRSRGRRGWTDCRSASEPGKGMERRRAVVGLCGVRRDDDLAQALHCSACSDAQRTAYGGGWMRPRARFLFALACVALLVPICGFAPDPSQKLGADLIVTAAPAYEPLAALRGGERFQKGAQLLLLHEGKAEQLVAWLCGKRRCERFI